MAEFPWETASRDMQFFVGMAGSAYAAKKQFKYNQRLIQMQQNWQERMSNTAHQREVSDLRAAGLNPILSATGGSGASVGSASAPSVSVENPVNSGFVAMNMSAERKLMKQNANTAESQEHLNNSQKKLTDTQEQNEYLRSFNIHNENEAIIQKMYNDNALNDAIVAKTLAERDAIKMDAETNRMNANTNSARAQSEIKWNARRASGYSETNSSTVSGGANVGRHGIGGSGSYSRSRSRTW